MVEFTAASANPSLTATALNMSITCKISGLFLAPCPPKEEVLQSAEKSCFVALSTRNRGGPLLAGVRFDRCGRGGSSARQAETAEAAGTAGSWKAALCSGSSEGGDSVSSQGDRSPKNQSFYHCSSARRSFAAEGLRVFALRRSFDLRFAAAPAEPYGQGPPFFLSARLQPAAPLLQVAMLISIISSFMNIGESQVATQSPSGTP